jgi:hypothetical protein
MDVAGSASDGAKPAANAATLEKKSKGFVVPPPHEAALIWCMASRTRLAAGAAVEEVLAYSGETEVKMGFPARMVR